MTPYFIEQLGRLHAEDLRQARARAALLREAGCHARNTSGPRRLHAPSWLRRGGYAVGCEA